MPILVGGQVGLIPKPAPRHLLHRPGLRTPPLLARVRAVREVSRVDGGAGAV